MSLKSLYAIFIALAVPAQVWADQVQQIPAPGQIQFQQEPAPAPAPARGRGKRAPSPAPVKSKQAQAPAPAQAQVQPAQAPARIQVPASAYPVEKTNAPFVAGSGQARPQGSFLPQFLPNGAPNLDWYWTQDGGARPYWNEVSFPQQLKMNGANWVDPALVPQLIPDRSSPRRKSYHRSGTKKRIKSSAPVAASSRSLKKPASPVPVEQNTADKPERQRQAAIPPLAAPIQNAAPAPVANGTEENREITPPPLQ